MAETEQKKKQQPSAFSTQLQDYRKDYLSASQEFGKSTTGFIKGKAKDQWKAAEGLVIHYEEFINQYAKDRNKTVAQVRKDISNGTSGLGFTKYQLDQLKEAQDMLTMARGKDAVPLIKAGVEEYFSGSRKSRYTSQDLRNDLDKSTEQKGSVKTGGKEAPAAFNMDAEIGSMNAKLVLLILSPGKDTTFQKTSNSDLVQILAASLFKIPYDGSPESYDVAFKQSKEMMDSIFSSLSKLTKQDLHVDIKNPHVKGAAIKSTSLFDIMPTPQANKVVIREDPRLYVLGNYLGITQMKTDDDGSMAVGLVRSLLLRKTNFDIKTYSQNYSKQYDSITTENIVGKEGYCLEHGVLLANIFASYGLESFPINLQTKAFAKIDGTVQEWNPLSDSHVVVAARLASHDCLFDPANNLSAPGVTGYFTERRPSILLRASNAFAVTRNTGQPVTITETYIRGFEASYVDKLSPGFTELLKTHQDENVDKAGNVTGPYLKAFEMFMQAQDARQNGKEQSANAENSTVKTLKENMIFIVRYVVEPNGKISLLQGTKKTPLN